MGHWKKLQQEQDLGHRSDVDLKDKWRNIVKSVKANKQMRGVVLGPEDIARVQVLLSVRLEFCVDPDASRQRLAPFSDSLGFACTRRVWGF